jgi:hypothetical protein
MRASLIALAAGASLAASGCGECTPVTDESTAKVVGTYECQQTVSLESCSGFKLCEGTTLLKISRGDAGEWVVGKTECQGKSYELKESVVCEPPAESAGSYQITASHDLTEPGDNPHATYSISLNVSETGGTDGAPSVDGSLTINVTPANGDTCTAIGRITGSCLDCVKQ